MSEDTDELLALMKTKFGNLNATQFENGHYAVRIPSKLPDQFANDDAKSLPVYRDAISSGFLMGEPVGDPNHHVPAMAANKPELKLAKMIHLMLMNDGIDTNMLQTTREVMFTFDASGDKRQGLIDWFTDLVPLPTEMTKEKRGGPPSM